MVIQKSLALGVPSTAGASELLLLLVENSVMTNVFPSGPEDHAAGLAGKMAGCPLMHVSSNFVHEALWAGRTCDSWANEVFPLSQSFADEPVVS